MVSERTVLKNTMFWNVGKLLEVSENFQSQTNPEAFITRILSV